jgi:hypothetical protein
MLPKYIVIVNYVTVTEDGGVILDQLVFITNSDEYSNVDDPAIEQYWHHKAYVKYLEKNTGDPSHVAVSCVPFAACFKDELNFSLN